MKKFGEYIVDDNSIFCGEYILIAREQDLEDLEKAINFIKLGISELKNKEEVLEKIMDGVPKIEKKGCRKYFKPFGEDEVETAWKCGDEWNGKKLFCNECVKGEKNE